MPFGHSSTASDCARPRSANFALLNATAPPRPRTQEVAPVKMIAPAPHSNLVRRLQQLPRTSFLHRPLMFGSQVRCYLAVQNNTERRSSPSLPRDFFAVRLFGEVFRRLGLALRDLAIWQSPLALATKR